ncbi:MAG: ABC transporter ATP-binding protein [Clostridia bacterium]|nr:MAG: ABC transporter ATP-binding protein [Clostridia bacterium]
MLSIENIEVVYDEVIYAVKGVSVKVPDGQIVTLLGPNGAGKTSILRAMSGILKSREGEITGGNIFLDGQSIAGHPPEKVRRAGIYLIPEGGGLFEDLTVEENLRLGLLHSRGDQADGLGKAWEWFPVLQQRAWVRAGYLSGGEQQMLALARALLARPKVLMLDEPSLGLAPLIVDELFGFIRKINEEEGISILLIEQNARRALAIASYGYIMENGKIVLDAPAGELLQDKEVKEFYLGFGQGSKRRSYRDVKHYKRTKRWLS